MNPSHIVVADPDPQSRAVLTWLLRERGYAVDACDAPDALRTAVQEREPDLVVLGFDGPEGQRALDSLDADPRLADVPVIAAMDRHRAPDDVPLARGVTDVVARPILVRQFLARVEAQLRLREALREARARSDALELELQRVRDEAAASHEVMEIVHEIVGEGSTTAIYRVLARRLARALGITRCSVVLASPGDSMAMVAVAHDDVSLQDFAIRLEDYPEITDALESGRPVLVEDAPTDARLRDVARMRHGVAQLRSAIVLPFTLDRWRAGVLFLRTRRGERALTQEDLEFAEPVLRAAVAAVRRSQVLESTRADNQRLEALATTDPLTRLLNRRALHDRLASEVQRADRYGAVLTLMLIDVDHFKQVNDTHGHLIGDAVLAQLAGVLQASLRTVDVAARYGG
ncbi:MAG: diguanylate cyclase, partial [Gemmatimonadaceae bacterium]|nr:diguanylate cyclase [Gemmatimonadaceae bacterium]